MGLAPYGRPRIFEFDVFEFKEGRVFLKYDWMRNIDPFLGGKYRCFSEYFQYYADLAYFAQDQLKRLLYMYLMLIMISILIKTLGMLAVLH